MGDETWANIQLVKSKRERFREKFKRRKAERETILNYAGGGGGNATSLQLCNIATSSSATTSSSDIEAGKIPIPVGVVPTTSSSQDDSSLECALLECLNEALPPVQSIQLSETLSAKLRRTLPSKAINNLLEKFAYKELISITQGTSEGRTSLTVVAVEHSKVTAVLDAEHREKKVQPTAVAVEDENHSPEKSDDTISEPPAKILREEKETKVDKEKRKERREDDVMSLLSAQSIRERETKKVGEEIMELLSKPTAKEQSLAQRFRSQGGAKVQEFCPHGTKEECERATKKGGPQCGRLHFRKIIQKHTDESLGDCSFLNTCFHMDTCRKRKQEPRPCDGPFPRGPPPEVRTTLFPSVDRFDLRFLDMSLLGKFAVIMADPPWDIHMELPYGTMSDDEMRQLNIPMMQEEGLIFLWVTGRAMELGRECLKLWGYERVDEIIWVKTNQLQRIIRTGRTGHWLNHGKEHCLVGMKGNPKVNRGLDGDVIVAEVRATSHKPDEIYGIIERLSPGTRKLELFGRPHNVQPNWVTLGNQLEGVNLLEEDLVKAFKERYPDGICCKQTTQ
ncbi:N6-adenosine-methyltransferase catalytic subunit-like [Penaeus chinensis]|uniref:N6-adenosine-methyltransferase catalytic subunit-like n=1 Tax=Penaeus chinensis TaxID=139456 RepID=UPI001FB611F4|nr:N6-adenosine-methyltransferase catalytic subunit-like [Penaeus chinensis]